MAGNEQIAAPIPAIRANAGRVEQVAATVDKASRRSAAVALDAATFGPLSQDLSPRLDAGRRLALDTTHTAIEAMHRSAGGLRTEAAQFRIADELGVDDVHALELFDRCGPRDFPV